MPDYSGIVAERLAGLKWPVFLSFALCSAGILVSALVFLGAGLRFSDGSSMPAGIWRLARGDVSGAQVVLWCPEPEQMLSQRIGIDCPGWRKARLKPVIAGPGDTVVIDEHGVSVNGALLPGSRVMDISVEQIQGGEYEVGEGEYWLVSTHDPLSYDSRYYGAVSENQIIAGMTRVIVFGEGVVE